MNSHNKINKKIKRSTKTPPASEALPLNENNSAEAALSILKSLCAFPKEGQCHCPCSQVWERSCCFSQRFFHPTAQPCLMSHWLCLFPEVGPSHEGFCEVFYVPPCPSSFQECRVVFPHSGGQTGLTLVVFPSLIQPESHSTLLQRGWSKE